MTEPTPPHIEPATLVARLREYISPHDPTWAARIQPCTDEDLAHYAGLAGLGAAADALPAAYRAFARAMGGDCGGLFKGLRIDTRVREIVTLYQEYQQFEPDAINPLLPVVGLYIVGDQISLDLRAAAADPAVADTSNGEWVQPLSRSWEALVMQAAVLYVEPRRLPFARWYSRPASRSKVDPAVLHAALAGFGAPVGLIEAWPSDAGHSILVSAPSSLYMTIHADGSALLYAFSADRSFLQRVDAELAPSLGMTHRGTARLIAGSLQDSAKAP